MRLHGGRLAAVSVLVLGLSGCGQVGRHDVAAVATTFYRAYEAGDGARACAQLAPKTKSRLEQVARKPCAEAVLEEHVPAVRRPLRVQVFGTQAQVDYRGDTTFLARFQGGWKVMAASCTPQPGLPYDCQISGG